MQEAHVIFQVIAAFGDEIHAHMIMFVSINMLRFYCYHLISLLFC
jgi:hypothetical protein